MVEPTRTDIEVFAHGLKAVRDNLGWITLLNVDSGTDEDECKVDTIIDAKNEALGRDVSVPLDRWRQSELYLTDMERRSIFADPHEIRVKEHVRVLASDMAEYVLRLAGWGAPEEVGPDVSVTDQLNEARRILDERGVPKESRFAAFNPDAFAKMLSEPSHDNYGDVYHVFADPKVPAFVMDGQCTHSFLAHRDAFTVVSRPMTWKKSEKEGNNGKNRMIQAVDTVTGIALGLLVRPRANATIYSWRMLYGAHHWFPLACRIV